jgi:hypothetical protein
VDYLGNILIRGIEIEDMLPAKTVAGQKFSERRTKMSKEQVTRQELENVYEAICVAGRNAEKKRELTSLLLSIWLLLLTLGIIIIAWFFIMYEPPKQELPIGVNNYDKDIAVLKQQIKYLSCPAHEWEFIEKEPAHDIWFGEDEVPAGWFVDTFCFKCKHCGKQIEKTEDELTVEERNALTELNIISGEAARRWKEAEEFAEQVCTTDTTEVGVVGVPDDTEDYFIEWEIDDSNEFYLISYKDMEDLTDRELADIMIVTSFSSSTWPIDPDKIKIIEECYRKLLPKRYWRTKSDQK